MNEQTTIEDSPGATAPIPAAASGEPPPPPAPATSQPDPDTPGDTPEGMDPEMLDFLQNEDYGEETEIEPAQPTPPVTEEQPAPAAADEPPQVQPAQQEPAQEQPPQSEAPAQEPELTPAQKLLQDLGLMPQGMAAQSADPAPQPAPEVQAQPQQPLQPQPVQQPVPQAAPVQAPVQQPVTDAQTQAYVQNVREQQVHQLAANTYALDKETQDALEASGNEALIPLIPQYAARVFVDAVQAIGGHMRNVVPQMVGPLMQQQQQHRLNEEAFYTFWDGQGYNLREHEGAIQQSGLAFRQQNPNASPADFIKHVGAMVVVGQQLAGQAQQQAQVQPAQPQPQPQQAAPFQSAAAGPSAHQPQPQLSGWEALDNELFAEEYE